MTDLAVGDGASSGRGINDSTQISGTYESAEGTSGFFYSNGTAVDLGSLNTCQGDVTVCGQRPSEGWGINNSGQVTGRSLNDNGIQDAFLYSSGTMTDLGALGDGSSGDGSLGESINNKDSAEVTGWTHILNSTSVIHAFLYSAGTMVDLGSLKGEDGASEGLSINDVGSVTGWSETATQNRAFLYPVNGVMADLGSLDGPGQGFGQGNSINKSGWITGWSDRTVGPSPVKHAFFFYVDPTTGNGTMYDVNDLILPNSGITVESGEAINDLGQIAATGIIPPNAESHALVLTPTHFADLQVTVTDKKSAVLPNATDTYTIVVTNLGPNSVTGVLVNDSFPSSFINATYTAGGTGGATGFTSNGSGDINDAVMMPANSQITYTATGKIKSTATGTLANTASVTIPAGVTDPNLADNSATDTDTITPKADLKITVNDGKTAAARGKSNTYTIVAINRGPSDISGVIVSDIFPADFTGVSYFATPSSSGVLGYTGSGRGDINDTITLPARSRITYKAIGTISASATGSISDTATVTPPGSKRSEYGQQ